MAGASSSSERRAKGHQVFISLADTILRICWQKVAQWVMTAGAATVTVVRGGHPMKQPNDRRTHHNREVREGSQLLQARTHTISYAAHAHSNHKHAPRAAVIDSETAGDTAAPGGHRTVIPARTT